MVKRQKWKVGDLFKIPLADGSASLGHIVAQEREMLNSVTCAFYDTKVPDTCPPHAPPLPREDALIACLFTTHDLLSTGIWTVIGHSPPQVSRAQLPHEDCRRKGWVGAKMRGSGIVRQFLDAYYCLAPWDDWADPKYLDAFLIDPSKKPNDLIYVKTTNA
ncbi:Imm26 family immunity protein [Prosthecobacter sp.]|uniref:Imm26 family immunity protein n=1 Tax=Prosthecobacter sp. TaxID=1965333 RepID=UPI0037845132